VALHIEDILHQEDIEEEPHHQGEDGHLLVGLEEHLQDLHGVELHHVDVHHHDQNHLLQGKDLSLVVDHLVKNLDHLQDLALAPVVEALDPEVNLKTATLCKLISGLS